MFEMYTDKVLFTGRHNNELLKVRPHSRTRGHLTATGLGRPTACAQSSEI
jgi:hypothetical protein